MLIAMGVCPAGAREATSGGPGDQTHPPKLPLAQWWSVPLEGPVSAGPATDVKRVYVAFTSGDLTARDTADGHELWRIKKTVTTPLAAGADLVYVASGDAVEALRGETGAPAWIVPRLTLAAPILLDRDLLFVVTDTDLVAIAAASGEVRWRRPAGGVRLPPAVDADQVYLGANDGRVLALKRADGAQVWEQFFEGGVTAIGAGLGRVYVGAGDKYFYCVKSDRKRDPEWRYSIGATAIGRVAIDDEHAYFTARDNTARGLDRRSGNQRWNEPLRDRPTEGPHVIGQVVFVPLASTELPMLYARNGRASGKLASPGDAPPNPTFAFIDSPEGATIYTVSGSLANEWHLTKFARAGEAALLPFAALAPLPGLPYLTDPILKPAGNVLQTLLLGDPLLLPLSDIGFPIVLRDPPLLPLTVLPGLQLRPLSPMLPARRGGL